MSREKEDRLTVLKKLKNSIQHKDPDVTAKRRLYIEKWTTNYVKQFKSVEDDELQFLCKVFQNEDCWLDEQLHKTALVISACKYDKAKILKNLFASNHDVFSNSSVGNKETLLLPDVEDDSHHNAFYYAIRSGNTDLLDTLISKWPEDYFISHSRELDEILSRAYEELKLKNVPLSEEMGIFVENKLINLRFFSDTSLQDRYAKNYSNCIKERIELVLKNINLLETECSITKEVDEKFLFIIKFIAQNVHILKRQIKSTYERIPWEEIEFCLVSFISSHVKRQEINLFYNASLNKSKILNYLKNFAKNLEEEKDNIEVKSDLPNLKREKVVADIIDHYPEFEELYRDYQQIRDIYSLEKISAYIKLALLSDPKQREGQLIITRVLQVIGEYLKNTLESPKLSSTTSELLLLSLPKNTRQVIIDLRNSISHAYSLSTRREIQENADVKFFVGVQNDTKRIDDVITDILFNNKIKMIKLLLNKVVNSESFDEIKEVAEILNNIELDIMFIGDSKATENENRLDKLITEFSNCIVNKTNYEKELFNKINNIILSSKTKSKNIKNDYITALMGLKSLEAVWNDKKIDHNGIIGIKFFAKKTLENIPSEIESYNLREIAELSLKISRSARSRMQIDFNKIDNLNKLTCEIFYIAEFGTGDLKWIEELRNKLNDKGSFIHVYKQKRACNITQEKNNQQFEIKVSELKNILKKNEFNDNLIEKFPCYKTNNKLQAAIEMLVLDIMSILSLSEKHLENNLLFLDDNTPLLTGKSLRNLAHDNILLDVLSTDPSKAVILNAKKLVSGNVIKSKKKVGKFVRDDPLKLKDKFDQSLKTITNQEKMFTAIKEGNLEDLKSYLKKGSDIYARSIDSSTALHFAAQESDLKIIEFILDQKLNLNVKNIKGQSPVHIAAAYGRKDILEFFIREKNVCIDDPDIRGKTALHVAAENGQISIVELLLKNNADTDIKDVIGFSPLHYAIKNNHIDLAKMMLEKEVNVDVNETMGGFTSLHISAENGYLEIVNFLLKYDANVNARTDQGTIPLHLAALNGHLDVVNALILKGADVNWRVVNGCTPLHYAIENGHDKIANILLKNGANVDVVDRTYNNTPLHYAAKDGYETIVQDLLIKKANGNAVTVQGTTPLHLAAKNNHLKIVTALLKYGVNIHAKDKRNAAPIHLAVESGHKDTVQLLIKHGAEINDKTYLNLTALHVAALKGHKDIADLLIKHKAKVEAQDIEGNTPLHAAAIKGSKDIIDLLIKNKAEIDAKTFIGMTPLHLAAACGHEVATAFLIKNKAELNPTALFVSVAGGHKRIVNLLLKNEAKVNLKDFASFKEVFHLAVESGNKEIVKILIAEGASVNAKSSDLTPLLCAVKHNHEEIVEMLIENGANVNAEGGEPLSIAVIAGYKNIVRILLKNKAHINIKTPDDNTLLHLAAKIGHKEIVNDLILKGASIDALNVINMTPLFFAAFEGHEDVAEILIVNGADVNAVNVEGTTLHLAAGLGHLSVVAVLLNNGAKVNTKDNKNRTPLELAVANGHLQVVKILLESKDVEINARGNDGWTLLHIATQSNNLKMVKYLVNKGSNLHIKNASGSKPIHIAAREGNKETVKFFLSQGLSISELGAANQTLLHYAAMKGQLEVVKYLITEGSNVNAKDSNESTPIHIAAAHGFKNVTEILLKSGAAYNAVDMLHKKPSEVTGNKDVIKVLASTEKLFDFVKRNNSSEIQNEINAGAFVNAKNVENGTPLHYAAWKGYGEVVKILLQNKADPNVINDKRITPLHYATKFSHLKIVKTLLFNGAVYDAVSESGKTPSDLAVDKDIINLFKLINESFKKVKAGNVKIINDLNKIKDIDTIKTVMRARNKEDKTLIVIAINNNFSKTELLKEILQNNVSSQMLTAVQFLNQGNYRKAMSIFQNLFERRKEILGPDNPGTLEIQTFISKTLYKQGNYQEALVMLEEIFKKQKEILGTNHQITLSTRSYIALVLHRMGQDEKAIEIYNEVYPKQKEILEPDHSDILETQLFMALVLDRLKKYDEALILNRIVFEKRKRMYGLDDLNTVSTQNNIAMVLANQGKFDEALEIYREVFNKKKKILSINHTDTLRTLHNIAGLLSTQKKYHEALKVYQDVLKIQEKVLQQNHPETLTTKYNIGNLFFSQGKRISAFKVYTEILDLRKAIFGPRDSSVLDISTKLEIINYSLKFVGTNPLEILMHLQRDINIAASQGDTSTVQRLLKEGIDANDKDPDGRTPIHFAVSNGHIDIVKILLKNEANVSQVTNKGNTPLHTATSKNYKEIVELLLQHVNCDKLSDFVNAKTTSGGTTSLHLAAKDGCFEIVKSLLKHGASYEILNKEGKMPVDLSKDQKVINLLRIVEKLFKDIKTGNIESMNTLKSVKTNDEFLAITTARNNQGNTLLQVAITNKHKNIVSKLLEMLKKLNQN